MPAFHVTAYSVSNASFLAALANLGSFSATLVEETVVVDSDGVLATGPDASSLITVGNEDQGPITGIFFREIMPSSGGAALEVAFIARGAFDSANSVLSDVPDFLLIVLDVAQGKVGPKLPEGETFFLGRAISTPTISLTVNTAPFAINDTVTLNEDSSLLIDVLANDLDNDGDVINVTTVGPATFGATEIEGGRIRYTPDADFFGEDSFSYTISDESGESSTASVSVTVNPLNDAPIANDDFFTVAENGVVAGNFLANNGTGADTDIDGENLSISAVNGTAVGDLTLTSGARLTIDLDGDFSFDPNGAFDDLSSGESRLESFSYTIVDERGDAATAVVSISVTGVNNAPIAKDDFFTVTESGVIGGNLLVDNGVGADADVDGGNLSIVAVNGAAIGDLTLPSGAQLKVSENGDFSYDPSGAFDDLSDAQSRLENFNYTIGDGQGGNATAFATITVNGVSSTPTDPPAPELGQPTNGNDSLIGTPNADNISALGGSDIVRGLGGNDTISGGGGSDSLAGDGGSDLLLGNGGKDLLQGGGGKDFLSGGGGKDILEGGGGKDTLEGGGGRDLLQGGGGKDLLDGQGGKDTMEGGGGRDTIIGGKSNDVLTGGRGRDLFVFDVRNGKDTITDFEQRKDKILIEGGAESFADLAITQFGDDVRIQIGSTRVTVEEDEVLNFTASDFIF